jgi:succinate dehydrogenase / fumarate reductase iron-sulfur subunit
VTAQSQGRVTDARRPPELSTRDNVSRAIYTEVREGRGSPHGGVFLDISYLPADHVRRKLPSMYDQFKELADVDITKGPMEVGPTTHYVMGGIRVDAETGRRPSPGLFAAGEVAGGMHGANRLGGNSLSDLLVFGQRTGAAAAATRRPRRGARSSIRRRSRRRRSSRRRSEPGERRGPVRAPAELQDDAVAGRHLPDDADLDEAIAALDALGPLAERPGRRRAFNPGWNLVFELRNLLDVVRGDCSQRAPARGVARRPQPDRLPRARREVGQEEQRRPARRRRHGSHDDEAAEDARRAPQPAGEGRTLMPDAHLRVFRGTPSTEGTFEEFDVPVEEGMVVLDALHWIQAHDAPDLAVRWNCKAAKCGSCSAEVNGRPSLTCKTRLSDFEEGETIQVEPMRSFPLVRDLVTDVSWNYEVNKAIPPFQPPADQPQETWRWQQEDIERVQEFRKCIECFLCQDVCHVLRNHETKQPFMGPRFLVRSAGLEMHPIDQADRLEHLKDEGGHRAVQHHEVLHRGLSRAHQDHRQRDHPAEGAGRRPLLRPGPAVPAQDPRWRQEGARRARAGRGVDGRRPLDGRCRSGSRVGADRREPELTDADGPATLWPDDVRAARTADPAQRGFVVRTDGAARGNPGPASAGAVLIDASRPDARHPLAPPDASISDFLGVQTNNVAEYTGVVRALALARDLGATEVTMLLDSKLIVEQLAGRWRVKDAKLIPLWEEARRTLRGFSRWSADHVPRAQNSAADALANEAIDRVAAGGPASVVRRPG